MYRRLQAALVATCAALTPLNLLSQEAPALESRIPSAPPTPPAPVTAPADPIQPRLRAAATLHSIGDPTPEEQLYIEMINRARANPQAESLLFATTTDSEILLNYDFFDVDLAVMQSQFASIAAAPPVAPNEDLTEAARRHSQDMLAKSFQSHTGSDGSSFDQRIADAGYHYSTVGENIYANAESVFHGHAGFEVDWGFGPSGMQTPPVHRDAVHKASFREVGVGVVFGSNEPPPTGQIPGARRVGPQLVTQEFGTRQGATPLITGVVYFDLNGNNFYDIGEGVGGVNVSVSGTATQAVTARSGGYAVPVAGNGDYTVTFSGLGITTFNEQVTVTSLQNEKADFRPTYTPPLVNGPASPAINNANNYTISPVAAAAGYQWRSFQLTTPAVEGAETGASAVTASIFGGYNLIQELTKSSGNAAFQLATPSENIREQSFVVNARYLVNANSTLRFQSRLGWATSTTFAIVQVSTNDGTSWQEVYRQGGNTGSPGETSFQARAISLAPFAGSIIRLRFSFLPTDSSYIDVDEETGWFIDDIFVDGGSQISNENVSQEIATPAFTFQPTVESTFVLQARARTGHDYLPWGPMLNVQSVVGTTTPPTLRVSDISIENGRALIEVDIESGTVPSGWVLESTGDLAGDWTTATTSAEVLSPTRVRFNVLARPSEAQQFYRVLGN